MLLALVAVSAVRSGLVQSDGTIKAAGSNGEVCAMNSRGMVRMAACNGADTQQWTYDAATKKVKNVASQTCMWVPATSDKNKKYGIQKIWMVHCDGHKSFGDDQMQFFLDGTAFKSEYSGANYCGWSRSRSSSAGYPLKVRDCNANSNRVLVFQN